MEWSEILIFLRACAGIVPFKRSYEVEGEKALKEREHAASLCLWCMTLSVLFEGEEK